jgi:hypothetical protein
MREQLLAEMEQEQAKPVAQDAMKTMVIHTFAFNGVEGPDPKNPDATNDKGGSR